MHLDLVVDKFAAAVACAKASGLVSPHLTALFTSAPILASSGAANSVRAKAVGHMAPSSRFAASLKVLSLHDPG
jgi:hypothetical protein